MIPAGKKIFSAGEKEERAVDKEMDEEVAVERNEATRKISDWLEIFEIKAEVS